MRYISRTRPILLTLILTCLCAPASAQYQLVNAFAAHTFSVPVDIQNAGDDRLFVVEKIGQIQVIDQGAKHLFLDIGNLVSSVGEAGLLGLAFPPDYAASGEFYVFYVDRNPVRAVVSRFHVSPGNPNAGDPLSEEIILSTDKPTSSFSHNGGGLAFSGRGDLHISIGDGTADSAAQDLSSLWGSILRIDVSRSDPGLAYAIPEDNPYRNNPWGYREEIYAFGLRNPWRISFDPSRPTLWVADVGLDTSEEINLVLKGTNYGWPLMEGNDCWVPFWCDTAGANLEPPVHVYGHDLGNAVIGGYVYRGTRVWSLTGHYIFGDYSSGRMWSFSVDGETFGPLNEIITNAPVLLTMGLDVNNELYVGAADGLVYQLERTVTAIGDHPSRTPPHLGAAFPNPFNPSTSLPFTLDASAHVLLTVHDARGREITRLEDARREAGSHRASWDGLNAAGRPAASGVYFATLRVDGLLAGRTRLVLLK